jgi:predicted nucleic acid-binding protein
VLIDSWCWIEYYKGTVNADAVAKYIEGNMIAYVSTINLSEIYRWFLLSYTDKEAKSALRDVKDRCFIVPVDEKIAVMAAKIKHELKWGLGDSIMLGTARTKNAKVVTGDPDFQGLDEAIFIRKEK